MIPKVDRKKNIAIIGAGNAACITAMYAYLRYNQYIDTITIYHDPSCPIEKVGQGSIVSVAWLINSFFKLDFVENNFIKSTRKEGIMYENWGKKKEKIFHSFPQHQLGIHYVPFLLSQKVLESGVFKVVEKNIKNPEQEIDSDFIFDCRGRIDRDQSLYENLINPLNSVLITQLGVQPDLFYTRTIATPDGWTFVIPNIDNTSYGYLYNNQITMVEQASSNFMQMFGINPRDCQITSFSFENYIAKNCFQGKRTALNGNRLCFLEPLEATSTGFYLNVAEAVFEHIIWGTDTEICNKKVKDQIKKLQDFILWHYQFGSKFDTPFWEYAKSFSFNPEPEFYDMINYNGKNSCDDQIVRKLFGQEDRVIQYGQWSPLSFKVWADGVGA